MPTKACYPGCVCFALNRWYCSYIESSVLSEELHLPGILLWVFSSQETLLCSGVPPAVSLSLISPGAEAPELQTQILEEHLGMCHLPSSCTFPRAFGCSWKQAPDHPGNAVLFQLFLFFFPTPSPSPLCAEKLIQDTPCSLPWLEPGISYRLDVERAMSNSGTGPRLPVYAATPQEKPPFLNYRILTVNADILDCPLQHLSSQ